MTVNRGTFWSKSFPVILRPVVTSYVSRAFGKYDWARPWLGPASRGKCDQFNRLLIRTASNAYFSQKLSVISRPKRNETISNAFDQVWAFIEAADSADELKIYRKMVVGNQPNTFLQVCQYGFGFLRVLGFKRSFEAFALKAETDMKVSGRGLL